MIGHYNELGLRGGCQVERLRDHGKIYQTLAEMQSKRTWGSRSSSSAEVRTGRESDETRRDECTAGISDDGVSVSKWEYGVRVQVTTLNDRIYHVSPRS